MEENEKMPTVPFNMYEARCFEYDNMIAEQRQEFFELLDNEKKDKEKSMRHLKHICVALALTLFLLIGGLVGGAFYIFANYDISTYTYEQSLENGNANIIGKDGDIVNGEPKT